MMGASARYRRVRSEDSGAGILSVIFVMAIVTALATTATLLTVNNLGNSTRDRQALSALATSEVGIARAVSFLRGGNLGSLTCLESNILGTCQGSGPSWISQANPVQVRVGGAAGACAGAGAADCYKVWISRMKEYKPSCRERNLTPPKPCVGVYRVHATGVSGNGPGARKLAVDVEVQPYPFPIGVFAETFSGNGNVGIHRQSLFSNGCVINRQDDAASGSGFQFEWDAANLRPKLDLVYDQPAAAHSTNLISTSNNVCGDSSGGARIHTVGNPCNATFKWDQSGWDTVGGSTDMSAGDPCHGKYVRVNGSGTVYPTSSKFSGADLQNYGYRPRGLTDAQYDALKTQAVAQDTYNILTTAVSGRLTALAAAGISSPVLYWDNGDVSLNSSDLPAAFKRTLSAASNCGSKSVTIVVNGQDHDLSYSGGNTSPYLVGSIFVPYGTLTGNGGTNTIGTVFANKLDLGGNADFFMDECFAANPPGGTLDVEVVNWREDDSKDVT